MASAAGGLTLDDLRVRREEILAVALALVLLGPGRRLWTPLRLSLVIAAAGVIPAVILLVVRGRDVWAPDVLALLSLLGRVVLVFGVWFGHVFPVRRD